MKTKRVSYKGYFQGWKIYINGIKYPKRHGHFYTTIDKQKALESAYQESRKY